MSSLKAVLDIGASFIPGVGKALDAGLGQYALIRDRHYENLSENEY